MVKKLTLGNKNIYVPGTTAFNQRANLRGHRRESARVEPSLPCTRHLSRPSYDSLRSESERERVSV